MLKIKCTKKGYTKKVSRDEYMQQTKDLKRCDSDILVTREKLAQLLQKGYAVILAEFNKYNSINIDNIKGVQLLALDVDEFKKITMKEMIKKLMEKVNDNIKKSNKEMMRLPGKAKQYVDQSMT